MYGRLVLLHKPEEVSDETYDIALAYTEEALKWSAWDSFGHGCKITHAVMLDYTTEDGPKYVHIVWELRHD